MIRNRLTTAVILLFAAGTLRADVAMPSIFGDHMVLQQEIPVPVWGSADPGEKVTVSVGSESAMTAADAQGKWRVTLPPLPGGSTQLTMSVTGKNALKFEDVVSGEVWLTAGQSNMELTLHSMQTGQADAAQATDPGLRLFQVARKPGLNPRTDFVVGKWVICSPKDAEIFSAVSYYFGRDLRAALKRPVGMISTSWGGTPVEAWISQEYLEGNKAFQPFLDKYTKVQSAFPAASVAYPVQLAAYTTGLAAWEKTVGVTFDPLMKAWADDVKKARLAGQPDPPKPVPPTPRPKPPIPPWGDLSTPIAMFNGNVAPVIPYAIRGVLWYQGESSGPNANLYAGLFETLIRNWRDKWGEGNFPFLYVQLPRFVPGLNWPLLRDQQFKTLSTPNAGMAVAIDVGDPSDVHPINKDVIAQRLALAALHLAYGQNIVWSGPVYNSMKVEGSSIRVRFTQTGSGLEIGSSPWIAPGAQAAPKDQLWSFSIAGADQNWFPAEAKIDGDTVVVKSVQVPHPVAVRYGWENSPLCNLYNKEGLPAATFRTDDWEVPVLTPPQPQNSPPPPTPAGSPR